MSGNILVLDEVVTESKYLSKGIIIKELSYLVDKEKNSVVIKTDSLVPTKGFFNMLENQFCNRDIRRGQDLTDDEFERQKNIYLGTADSKLLLYAVLNKSNQPVIVTEETATSNDGKLFRKIPDCCGAIDIESCTLPELFEKHYGIDLGGLLSGTPANS